MADVIFDNPHQLMTEAAPLAITPDLGSNNVSTSSVQTYWFLQRFDEVYAPIHAYVSAIISVMGVLANLLTILVMSRADMRTPTNRLYAIMASADLVIMFLYSIFAIFFQIALPDSNKENLTELRAIFMVIYADLSVFAHDLSVTILVAVTVFRVLILQLPASSSKTYCSLERAHLTAVIAFFSCVLIILPNVYVTSWRFQQDNGVEYWEVYQREDEFSAATAVVNFWFQAIFVKLLPCLLLTLASISIVKTLQEAEARRRRLQGNKPKLNNGNHNAKSSADPRIRNRTLMLLGLLLAFLLTEFPQGILTLVCGIMGDAVWSSIYMPLGNLLDMMTLLNAGINFILFASMSSEFRLALHRQLSNWFSCYAEMLAKKEHEKSRKRLSNGHVNPTPSTKLSTPASHAGNSLLIEQHQQLLTQSGVSVSLKSYLGTEYHEPSPSVISTLILTDLDTLVDGELVVKKSKSPSKSGLSSRTSSASSASKKDALLAKAKNEQN